MVSLEFENGERLEPGLKPDFRGLLVVHEMEGFQQCDQLSAYVQAAINSSATLALNNKIDSISGSERFSGLLRYWPM